MLSSVNWLLVLGVALTSGSVAYIVDIIVRDGRIEGANNEHCAERRGNNRNPEA